MTLLATYQIDIRGNPRHGEWLGILCRLIRQHRKCTSASLLIMVNQAELEICRRRGHAMGGMSKGYWSQCRWCGLWLREVIAIEEREDKPPDNKIDPLGKLSKIPPS
jgi:hypothetical protein